MDVSAPMGATQEEHPKSQTRSPDPRPTQHPERTGRI